MSKKLPYTISTEDLLASLESAIDVETVEWTNDVPVFLSKFKIEQGKYCVSPTSLYSLYTIFSKDKVSRDEFYYTAAKFIPRTSRYYKLNIKPTAIAKILHGNKLQKSFNFTTSVTLKRHFEKFMKTVGLKKGTKWVEGSVLHECYRFYCIDNKVHSRMIYKNFTSVCKLYFDHKRIGSSKAHWYKVDEEVIKMLTEEDIQRLNDRKRIVSDKTKQRLQTTLKEKKDGRTKEKN